MSVTEDGVLLSGRVVNADAAARGELMHETVTVTGVTGRVLVRGKNGRTLITSIFPYSARQNFAKAILNYA